MYYLFIRDKRKLAQYKAKFDIVKANIEKGVTPVFNEVSSARTGLVESIPYNIMQGVFVIMSAWVLNSIHISELMKIGVVLLVNNTFGSLSCFIFANIKHMLRISLCERLGIEPSDRNIAVMESLEYQTV